MTGVRARVEPVVRRFVRGNRWLVGAVAALFVVTAALDPTTGAGGSVPLLDLAAPPAASGGDGGRAPAPSLDAPVGVGLPDLALPLSVEDLAPSVGADGFSGAPGDEASPPDGSPPPPPPPPPPSPPPAGACAAADVIAAINDAQAAVEATAGTSLGVDVGAVFAGLAGCGESGDTSPLDVLGAVGQVLDLLGIGSIPLPAPPPLPLPSDPPPGFDTLGPVVLPVCATVIQQLITAAAVAPALRISTTDFIALFEPVIQVCALFAPRA